MKLKLATTILFTLVAASAAARMKIESRYDQTYFIQNWKSFDFKKQFRSPTDALAKDKESEGRIREALEKELVTRGLKRKTGGDIDFLIAFTAGVGQKLDSRSLSYGVPGSWRHDFWSDSVPQATLLVDFVDARANQVVWRGTAKAVIIPGEGKRKIGPAVDKLIDRFMKDRAERERKRRDAPPAKEMSESHS